MAAGDAGVGAGGRDVIIGFGAGIDVIDPGGVDANAGVTGHHAYVWNGTAAFGSVAGQLRLVGGVNAILQGDVNADGVADFAVQLSAVATSA